MGLRLPAIDGEPTDLGSGREVAHLLVQLAEYVEADHEVDYFNVAEVGLAA
jgi:hypothetical protein